MTQTIRELYGVDKSFFFFSGFCPLRGEGVKDLKMQNIFSE